MTRGDVITRGLTVLGDTNLVAEGRNWMESVLYEIESVGYWKWLEKTVSYTMNVATVSFTGAGISDYSKGMSIYDQTNKNQLIQVSKMAMNAMSDGAGGTPKFFSIDYTAPGTGNIDIYPAPTSDVLKLTYYKELTMPTADNTELADIPGIPKKYHKYLIDGFISEAAAFLDNPKLDRYRQLFDRGIGQMIKDNEDFSTIKEQKYDKTSGFRTVQRPSGLVDKAQIGG